MAEIGGPPSPYDSSIYYYNSYEENITNNNGKVWTVVKNILIQTTVIEPYRYIIDVLTGNYISVLLSGLQMITDVALSSANVNNGGKTR